MTRSRIAAVIIAAAALIVPASAARAEFADVVRALEARAGGHSTPIPLFGLVRMVIWIAHPDGVHDVQLATWEHNRVRIDGRDIEPLLRAKGGRDYRPIVRTRSRNGEWTYIYARPAKSGLMDIMVVAHDSDDTVVVRAVVEPQRLADQINESSHRQHGHGLKIAFDDHAR